MSEDLRTCGTCDGNGEVRMKDGTGDRWVCPRCHGTGKVPCFRLSPEAAAERSRISEVDDILCRLALPVAEKAVRSVLAERARQDAKWGVQDHAAEMWLVILGEEYGEACQAALSDRFGGNAEKPCGQLRAEIVQVAAVAIAMIEWMDRKAAVKEASGNGTHGTDGTDGAKGGG